MSRDAMREGDAERLARPVDAVLRDDERVGSALIGGVIALVGARHGGVLGALLGAAGAYGVYRGVTGRCPVSRSLGLGAAPETLEPARATASIAIEARREELYGFWRDLRNRPSATKHLAAIPSDAEIVEDAPGQMLAWRSRSGALVQQTGRVRFVPTPDDRGTEVHVELERAARPGVIATLIGASAKARLHADLLRLKQLFEGGELTKPRPLRNAATALLQTVKQKPASSNGHSERRPNGHGRSGGRTDN